MSKREGLFAGVWQRKFILRAQTDSFTKTTQNLNFSCLTLVKNCYMKTLHKLSVPENSKKMIEYSLKYNFRFGFKLRVSLIFFLPSANERLSCFWESQQEPICALISFPPSFAQRHCLETASLTASAQTVFYFSCLYFFLFINRSVICRQVFIFNNMMCLFMLEFNSTSALHLWQCVLFRGKFKVTSDD